MSPASHLKNPALQDSYRIFNQDCELVSQLPIFSYKAACSLNFLHQIFSEECTFILIDLFCLFQIHIDMADMRHIFFIL